MAEAFVRSPQRWHSTCSSTTVHRPAEHAAIQTYNQALVQVRFSQSGGRLLPIVAAICKHRVWKARPRVGFTITSSRILTSPDRPREPELPPQASMQTRITGKFLVANWWQHWRSQWCRNSASKYALLVAGEPAGRRGRRRSAEERPLRSASPL